MSIIYYLLRLIKSYENQRKPVKFTQNQVNIRKISKIKEIYFKIMEFTTLHEGSPKYKKRYHLNNLLSSQRLLHDQIREIPKHHRNLHKIMRFKKHLLSTQIIETINVFTENKRYN